MLTSLNVDLNDISDLRKTAMINDQFLKLDVDIATIQNTRISDTGTIKKELHYLMQGQI